MRTRWTTEEAWAWRKHQGPILGCNFIPSTAVNQLEFWQEESFDLSVITRELDWAAGLGMNALRVFLHDLVYCQNPDAFKGRFDAFLSLAYERGLRVMPVLFDDCWYDGAILGRQPDPVPGVHNSRWLQSPGLSAARNEAEYDRLQQYITDMVGSFASDKRILLWDIYNEVGNFFLPLLSKPFPYKQLALAQQFIRFTFKPVPTLPLFLKAAAWARSVDPEQPISSALWFNNDSLNTVLIEQSDVISFHHYKDEQDLVQYIEKLGRYGRPLLCTEYLARTEGNTFQSCLPLFAEYGIPCFNWGLVAGKTQTIYTWKDRRRGNREPELWYHDILRSDGTPFSHEETALLQRYLTACRA